MSNKTEKTNSTASTSKIIVISPEQLAKMGLTSAIQNLVKSQASSSTSVKNSKDERDSKSATSSSEDLSTSSKHKHDTINGEKLKSKCEDSNRTESPSTDHEFKKPLTSALVSTPFPKKKLLSSPNNRNKVKVNVINVSRKAREARIADGSNDSSESQSIIEDQKETPPNSKIVVETKQINKEDENRQISRRGKKRKLDEDSPNLSLGTNSPVASPRGRKRKVLDYAKLNSGEMDEDFEESGGHRTELVTPKSKNRNLKNNQKSKGEKDMEPSLDDDTPVIKKGGRQKKTEKVAQPKVNLQESKKRKISSFDTSERSQSIDEASEVEENSTITKKDSLDTAEKPEEESSVSKPQNIEDGSFNTSQELISCSEFENSQDIDESGKSLDSSRVKKIDNKIKLEVIKKKCGRPKKAKEESVNPSPMEEKSSENSINDDDKESSSLLEETTDKPPTVRRRRGRPRKPKLVQDGDGSKNFEANTSLEERPKRQSVKSKRVLDSDYVTMEESDSEEAKVETPKKEVNVKGVRKKAGKPVGENTILGILLKQFVARLQKVLDGKESLLRDESQKNKPVEGENLVKCVICKEMIKKSSFSTHKVKHNNIAWYEGEKPLDLTDFQEISKTFTMACKKKDLRCDFCGIKKKSVVGFLGHYVVCLKSPDEVQELKMPCPFCGHAVMPFSAPTHYKAIHPGMAERKYNKSIVESPTVVNTEDSEDGSNKRKAAVKAKELLNILKEKGGIVDGNNDGKPKLVFTNFKFKPTMQSKIIIGKEMAKNSEVRCRFKECTYTSKDVKDLLDHISSCEHKPINNFTCKVCITPFATLEEAESHVDTAHTVEQDYKEEPEEESEDNDDDEVEDLGPESRVVGYKPKFSSAMILFKFKFLEGSLHQYRCNMYIPAYKWHLKFCEDNYSVMQLFDNILNGDQKLLDISSMADYLPKSTKSMYVSKTYVKKLNAEINAVPEHRQYKLFESDVDDNMNMMIFCGGPIESLAWLPTPQEKDDCDQILAVSVSLNPNSRVTTSPNTTRKGLIQFWNFGNMQMKWEPKQPELGFCFAHDFGVIHQIQWCPSGCYTDKTLGLLAVASSDSNVYLYVVKREYLGKKFSKPKPLFRLSVNISETCKGLAESAYVPTRISWSKAKHHNYMVVGYYNGTIALYKLDYIKKIEDDISLITPILVFHAHIHSITFLEISPLNGGNRWVVSGSLDRTLRYWDLNNPMVPILSNKKLHITSGVWNHHWLGVLVSHDDGTAILPNGTSYTYFRNKIPTNILYSMSCINCISGSEWTNTYIQGSSTGEITGAFPTQLFWNGERDKKLAKKRFMLGYMRLLKKGETSIEPVNVVDKVTAHKVELNCNENLDTIYEPKTYEEAKETYNVTFCDFKLTDPTSYVTVGNVDAKAGLLEETKLNRYPVTSINKITINPNKQCFNYYASGYQIGFVKVHSMFSKFRIF